MSAREVYTEPQRHTVRVKHSQGHQPELIRYPLLAYADRQWSLEGRRMTDEMGRYAFSAVRQERSGACKCCVRYIDRKDSR